ncbi:DUF3124 domain-containing protein [Bizionia sediminis]|uniref:DUF3124 domain-containing protein n=1 Tax=Bizionia sediminis TaxID=1737064 RepID=A0ABW5KQ43_9FLAO
MIRRFYYLFFVSSLFLACHKTPETDTYNSTNWSDRYLKPHSKNTWAYGKTYLSIYSQIYSMSQHKTHNLTAMASMRNISDTDTLYILSAKYYDSHGQLIRTFFNEPIYLAPLETTEAIIEEFDDSGGTGSNFIFEWQKPANAPDPLFEGIMNSTLGQQGLSFTTTGVRMK